MRSQYLAYPLNYGIGLVVNKSIDADIERYIKAKRSYPNCVKFSLRSDDYKNCVIAADSLRSCLKGVERKKIQKEAQERTICQKQSYTRFPDSLLKDAVDRMQESKRRGLAADNNNKNSFESIGIGESDLDKFRTVETTDTKDSSIIKDDKSDKAKKKKSGKIVKDDESKDTSEEEDRMMQYNNSDGLYEKIELTRIRRRYIAACEIEVMKRVKQYREELVRECDSIKN